ncbi:hypothetical protein PybrP1_012163 [[Pythium] brassicae (nom. inval.)]|nr:hypothetical protein PybrP1_012163 [[Pythium] brassicae (nom. inval.)]
MPTITQTDLDYVGRVVCMPLALLINFSLFQYLFTMYYKRRYEARCMVLLFSGFLAFACLIPYAHTDDAMVADLNDISETLSVTTFLVQITMFGRDINKRMRIRSLKLAAYASEVLIFLCITVSTMDLVALALPHATITDLAVLSDALEEFSLWFIFVFRFYCMAISRGVQGTLATKKFEIAMYLLFVTHEYPFQILNALTGLSWEEQQALWHRLTMALCLFNTIKEKLRSSTSKVTTRGASKAASMATDRSQHSEPPVALPRPPILARLSKRFAASGPSLAAVVPTPKT